MLAADGDNPESSPAPLNYIIFKWRRAMQMGLTEARSLKMTDLIRDLDFFDAEYIARDLINQKNQPDDDGR